MISIIVSSKRRGRVMWFHI